MMDVIFPKWDKDPKHHWNLKHMYDNQLQSRQASVDCWKWLGHTTTETDLSSKQGKSNQQQLGARRNKHAEVKKRLATRTFFAGEIGWLPRIADQLRVKGRQPEIPDPGIYCS